MSENKLRPSLFGGYPHEGIKSLEVFPNRIITFIEDKKVMAHINHEHYPQIANGPSIEDMRDFLLDRIHDYNHALTIAENQIRDMRVEYPFQPDDFGFEDVQGGYSKGVWVAVRGRGTNWLFRDGHGKKDVMLDLPNAHIAYITLRAMGIVCDEEFEKGIEMLIEIKDGKEPQTDGELF